MTVHREYRQEDLIRFQPRHRTFVGIDSDGCVFDTMEVKQKKCFHALIVSHWSLQPIEQYVRESAEFVNLYSRWRGQNRFVSLLMSLELLRDRPEVESSGVKLPDLAALRRFVDSGVPLSNPELERMATETGDPGLASLLKWSRDVNAAVAATVRSVPPFPWALKGLRKIHGRSDAICVSQTPTEALVREWDENGITPYVSTIAGQELGTKAEHIAMATKGRYQPDQILMIGDAPGDFRAAKENQALYYPINPGREDASWERFHREAYDRFLEGTYRGAYEDALVREFDALLPDTPPWRK